MPPIHLPRKYCKFSDPAIADDIWSANIQWFAQNGDRYEGTLLVNWRKTTFVLLRPSGVLIQKKILRGNLLALNFNSAVSLYPSASFAPHWQLLDSDSLARAAHSPNKIKAFLLHRVEYPLLPGEFRPVISVHECPLNHGGYLVSTHNASTSKLPPDSEKSRLPALHRYRLTLPTSALTPPIWERISYAGTINSVRMDSFTYAGYGLSFSSHSRYQFPRLVCRPATGENTIDGTWTVPGLAEVTPDRVCLSPDTGALTVCSARGVDVYYYE
ncbi:hypothetical protein C8J57DRAFT_490465 [Mycena rebaudengoi]|nr:hypothetical protein C8J57DRAFT_490465 [Mycena rebaudengoi]